MSMHRNSLIVVVVGATLVFGVHVASASWLSDLTGINVEVSRGSGITVEVGLPDPVGAIRQIPEQLKSIVESGLVGGADILLATAIRDSKSLAEGSAKPLPPHVVEILSPHIASAVLKRARYTTDWGVTANATLQQFVLGIKVADAITLDDIVVFRDVHGLEDYELWAHELRHVEQFREQGGVDGFSLAYVKGFWELEDDARNRAATIYSALFSHGGLVWSPDDGAVGLAYEAALARCWLRGPKWRLPTYRELHGLWGTDGRRHWSEFVSTPKLTNSTQWAWDASRRATVVFNSDRSFNKRYQKGRDHPRALCVRTP